MKAGGAKRRNYGAVKRGPTCPGLFCLSEVRMGSHLAGTLPLCRGNQGSGANQSALSDSTRRWRATPRCRSAKRAQVPG